MILCMTMHLFFFNVRQKDSRNATHSVCLRRPRRSLWYDKMHKVCRKTCHDLCSEHPQSANTGARPNGSMALLVVLEESSPSPIEVPQSLGVESLGHLGAQRTVLEREEAVAKCVWSLSGVPNPAGVGE